ncbi:MULTISPECIES: hypothetical protein [Flavobacterium]|uniref:Uncharacterized protein n=1 Tax=Flavobacterium jumunjinense TaxID=998845 RepID=A0ABV5GJ92_9FLAO|nr:MULTISPECIES: hypothetical protein [Flavobacterium]
MTKLTKILLTIPSIIGIVYMLTFLNVDFFKWITNNIIGFEYQGIIVNGIILMQIGYLIYRLWNYKNVERKIKMEWTWLLIIFNFLSSLIFIWKKDTEFKNLN